LFIERERERGKETERESESPVFHQLGPQIELRFFIPFTFITREVRNKVTNRVKFVFLCWIERKTETERERERQRDRKRKIAIINK
jgi:hypothetical protein